MATQLERLDKLLSRMEAHWATAFREFIRSVNSPEAARAITDRIEHGDIGGANDIVASFAARMADVIPVIFREVGQDASEELAAMLRKPTRKAGPGDLSSFVAGAVNVGFGEASGRAADLILQNRLQFIQNFTEEQRQVTRLALADAAERGLGIAQTARTFRNAIGLNSYQEQWAISYERRLRSLDVKALTMALRNRRYDRTLERALTTGRALTEDQIGRMVDAYRTRALMLRSETIARTESLRAMSEARREAVEQMAEDTGIDLASMAQEWNATADERTRDWHASMNGQRVMFDEKFIDGLGNELAYPGDPEAPGETVINCRCVVTFDLLPGSQEFDPEAG